MNSIGPVYTNNVILQGQCPCYSREGISYMKFSGPQTAAVQSVQSFPNALPSGQMQMPQVMYPQNQSVVQPNMYPNMQTQVQQPNNISPEVDNQVNKVNDKTQNEIKSEVKNSEPKKVESQKIGLGEGIKLFAQGFAGQVKDIITGIFKQPIKTAATVIGTTGALLALPLIGVPVAVGGGVLAIGFGTIGATKLLYNFVKAVNQNSNGQYDEARNSIKNAGAAGVDVALSLPFIPKAVNSIKEFAKYGKIGFNASLVQDLKGADGFKSRFDILKKANNELLRSYDYQAVVDEQLKNLNLPDAQKMIIKQELLDFNVPEDKILDVALEKLKQHNGYNFDIKLKREQLPLGTHGYYSSNKGEIVIKKGDPLPPNPTDSSLRIVQKQLYNTDTYICTLEDSNGARSFEYIPKRILDDYYALHENITKNVCSCEGNDILTLVHEFEHMKQHGMITNMYGDYQNVSQQAKTLHRNVANAYGTLSPAQRAEAAKYQIASNNYTSANPVKYIQNELEVGARNMQNKAMQSEQFQRLEKVFKHLKPIDENNIAKAIVPAVVQAYNAVS